MQVHYCSDAELVRDIVLDMNWLATLLFSTIAAKLLK